MDGHRQPTAPKDLSYLDHLVQSGQVELVMRYGSPGRPEHRYHLLGANLLTGPAAREA
jgi:hypothetical protein